MADFYITGGEKLAGEIKLQGAKNSALPILAAALLVRGISVIHNCPNLSDVRAALKILKCLGCRCIHIGNDIYIDSRTIICNTVINVSSHMRREDSHSVTIAMIVSCPEV